MVSSRSGVLADSETATVVNAEQYLVDWDDGFDDEEEAAHNVRYQDGDSDADGASVSIDTYVWQDKINYIAWKTVFAYVSRPEGSAQGVTKIMDIFELFLL
jgi:hypothetical protein